LATIGHMQRGQNTVEPILPKEQAAAHANTRELLNPAQRRAIEEVLTSHDRVHGLQGLAGSGKTTALETIREGAERNGFAVEGFAPTSRAAAQLREAGISADTLQGFLVRGGQEQARGDPDRKHLYMVDESSLASTRQMQSFMEKIGPQDRVLLIGDTRQHQGVDAGKPCLLYTSLLNALADFIPEGERIVVIEDTSELRIGKPNLLASECQTESHTGAVSFNDLLKAALRWRPDRIILGEVRGEEARTLLDSFNTGHAGSMATIHALSLIHI